MHALLILLIGTEDSVLWGLVAVIALYGVVGAVVGWVGRRKRSSD